MPSGAPPPIQFSQLQYAKPPESGGIGQQLAGLGKQLAPGAKSLMPGQTPDPAAGTGLPGSPYAGPPAPNAGAPGQPTPGQAVGAGMSPPGLLQWLKNNLSPPVTPQGQPITAATQSPQAGMLGAPTQPPVQPGGGLPPMAPAGGPPTAGAGTVGQPLAPGAGPGIPFMPVQPTPFGGG